MNYLHHPNLLVQYWAAVNTEFDKILDSFVRNDGWLFQDMCLAAKKANIGAIYRCVCTVENSGHQGKEERQDHFLRVNFAILDAAKTQWLVPWRKFVIDPSKHIPPFLKRQVGGFFLLYMLYTNQPLPNRFKRKQKITMDSRDILAMHVFNATMQRLPKTDDQFRELGRQLVVVFNDLVTSEAFEFSAVNDTFATPCPSVRQLLSSKLCSFTNLIYTLKDLRDQLYYITYEENVKAFRSLVAYGRFLPKESTSKSNSKGNIKTDPDETTFSDPDKKWSVEEIKELENENDIGKLAHEVSCIMKSLDFGPILNRNRLTGIPEKVLDKELQSCGEVHKTHLRMIDNNVKKTRIRREMIAAAQKNSKDTLPTILKQYFSGNYDWIDNIFNKKTIPHPHPKVDIIKKDEPYVDDVKDDPLAEDDENMEVEDEDAWMTDDDNDLDDAEMMSLSPKKENIKEESPSKSPSPRKRKFRVLSMPTIH